MNIELKRVELKTDLKIIPVPGAGSDEWNAERKKGIGGSEIGKICEVSDFGSPLSVWMDKTGRAEPVDSNMAMQAGNRLEEVVGKWFTDETGIEFYKPDNVIFINPKIDFLRGNPDGLILDDNGNPVSGVEIKTASEFKKDRFNQELKILPDEYLLQCQFYMYLFDLKTWWIAYLIGGNKFGYFEIDRDDELIEIVLMKCSIFWDKVKSDEMPIPTYQDSDNVKELFESLPAVDEPAILIDYEEMIDSYINIDKEIKKLTNDKTAIKNQLISSLNGSEKGISEKWEINYKADKKFDQSTIAKEYPDHYNNYKISIFDKDGFKKDHKNLYEQSLIKGSRRFTVKERKVKK